jgi:PhnB protein
MPYLLYEDVGAALGWLATAFGFRERLRMSRPDGTVGHAEMAAGDGVILMGNPGPSYRNPRHLGQVTHSVYVYVDDVDAHFHRARDAGARILEEPADQPCGDRRYGAEDPEGHHWYFAARIR